MIKAGDTLTGARTFTIEEVEAFVRLSGDRGLHHLDKDEKGRLMVHGLLTATLPTAIGGSLNYIARTMAYEFIRPVFTGDTIETTVTVDRVQGVKVSVSVVCKNQQGKEVLMGTSTGVIR